MKSVIIPRMENQEIVENFHAKYISGTNKYLTKIKEKTLIYSSAVRQLLRRKEGFHGMQKNSNALQKLSFSWHIYASEIQGKF